MVIDGVKVREFLERFIDGDLSVIVDYDLGLCYNMSVFIGTDDAYDFVKECAWGWEHHSGSSDWPVGNKGCYSKYEGDKMRLRVSLATHLLTKVDDYED